MHIMILDFFVKNKKFYYLGTAGFGFIFGFSVCFLGRQNDLTPYNNTPIKLYGQYKKVTIERSCPVKGKASKDKKIYHLPGDTWYAKLKPTDCFDTEEAAQQAGFVKAKSIN